MKELDADQEESQFTARELCDHRNRLWLLQAQNSQRCEFALAVHPEPDERAPIVRARSMPRNRRIILTIVILILLLVVIMAVGLDQRVVIEGPP